jgi:sugar phosphate isomerase/epimerase
MSDGKGLSRRGFIGAAGGAAALGTLGPVTGVAGAHGRDHDDNRRDDYGFGRGDLPLSRIGIQLFTVRDLLGDNELDLPGTFEMLADAGYAEVEIGGTYDSVNMVNRTAAEFRALAEQYDLKPEGMHNPGGHNAWRANTQAVLDDAETLGLRYVGVASPNRTLFPSTHAGFSALADEFNTFGEAARARGLKFYFHNHPEDFVLDGGTPVYDTLLAETDPRLVYFEMDIAWFVAGGQDPYTYLREHGSRRFPLFHVKDLTFTAPAPPPPNVTPDTRNPRTTPGNVAMPNRPYWLRDVGKGDIDFAKIFSALRDLDDHHYFVEHDDAPEDETNDMQGQPLVRRPRNPAGSANTSWVSRKYLANLDVRRRRW